LRKREKPHRAFGLPRFRDARAPEFFILTARGGDSTPERAARRLIKRRADLLGIPAVEKGRSGQPRPAHEARGEAVRS